MECDRVVEPWKGYYLTAYGIAVKHGYEGTEAEWLASLEGKSAYDLAVEAGYEGTKAEWLSSLDGKSAYDLAAEAGYSGTKAQWLASLIGKSAYELAVDGGYTGTKEEWLSSLKGDKGDTGDSGVYIGETEPEDEAVDVWVDTSNNGTMEEVMQALSHLRYEDDTVTVDLSDYMRQDRDGIFLYNPRDHIIEAAKASAPIGYPVFVGSRGTTLYFTDGTPGWTIVSVSYNIDTGALGEVQTVLVLQDFIAAIKEDLPEANGDWVYENDHGNNITVEAVDHSYDFLVNQSVHPRNGSVISGSEVVHYLLKRYGTNDYRYIKIGLSIDGNHIMGFYAPHMLLTNTSATLAYDRVYSFAAGSALGTKGGISGYAASVSWSIDKSDIEASALGTILSDGFSRYFMKTTAGIAKIENTGTLANPVGEVTWICSGLTGEPVSVTGDRLYVKSGQDEYISCVDVTEEEVLWQTEINGGSAYSMAAVWEDYDAETAFLLLMNRSRAKLLRMRVSDGEIVGSAEVSAAFTWPYKLLQGNRECDKMVLHGTENGDVKIWTYQRGTKYDFK